MRHRVTATITLPAAWASAVMNNDFSGLDDKETARCKYALAGIARSGLEIVSCEDEPRFTWSYRLYDPFAECEGGDVLDFVAFATIH